jgi:hypothetical protein
MRQAMLAVMWGVLVSCGTPTDVVDWSNGGSAGLYPGVLTLGDRYPVKIDVPERMVVGEAAMVSIRTWGGGCTAKGHVDVTVNDMTAVLAPMDVYKPPVKPQSICAALLNTYEHEASITFERGGTATVLIRGSEKPGNSPIEVRFSVMVTP